MKKHSIKGRPDREKYHLELKNPNPGKEFAANINAYLRTAFKRDDPPLQYAKHCGTSDGCVLVRFSVCSRRQTLEAAGEDLCQRIFDRKGKSLELITQYSLLGVSASCESWQDMFNKAFFNYSLRRGPKFFEELQAKALEAEGESGGSYIPVWAMVLSFAWFAGLNFSIFTRGGPKNWWEASQVLSEAAAVHSSANFLENQGYKFKAKLHGVQVNRTGTLFEDEANSRKQELHAQIQKTAEVMKKCCDKNARLCHTAKLRRLLFELAESAAEMVASNEKLLELLKQRRLEAVTEIAGRAGGVVASGWTLISAFSFTTKVTVSGIAPVSTWWASGPLAYKTATAAACLNPWVAVAAGVFTAWHLGKALSKYSEKNELEREARNYEYVKSVVICAWSLASDTELMLGWIYNTKLVNPNKFLTADADEETRQRMEQFTEEYLKKVKAPRKEREKSVRKYLKRRRVELLEIGEQLLEGRPETPEGSDSESVRSMRSD